MFDKLIEQFDQKQNGNSHMNVERNPAKRKFENGPHRSSSFSAAPEKRGPHRRSSFSDIPENRERRSSFRRASFRMTTSPVPSPKADEISRLNSRIAHLRQTLDTAQEGSIAMIEQERLEFAKEKSALERERDAWKAKAKSLELEKKQWTDNIRYHVDQYRDEEKKIVQSMKSVLIAMENASSAKLARANPDMRKEERIQFSNQTLKILVGSVKGVIQSRNGGRRPGSDKNPEDHSELRELATALLVKFGSTMIYANNLNLQNCASRSSSRRGSFSSLRGGFGGGNTVIPMDMELINEYKNTIDELKTQLSEMEASRHASEKVKQLLFQQIQQEATKREEELKTVYNSLDALNHGRRNLLRDLKQAKEDNRRLSLQNKELTNQIEDHFSGALNEDVFQDSKSAEKLPSSTWTAI